MDIASAIDLIRLRAGEAVYVRLLDSIAADEVLLVSGSLIEGIGNSRSDLDLFVLSESRPLDLPVRMTFAGNSWLDIEYIRPRIVAALVDKLGRVDPKDAAQVAHLSERELDRYYRLAIGLVLKGSWNARPAFSLELFSVLVRSWAILHAAAFAARAVIALESGELTPAVRYASHAAHLCVEGQLAGAGQLYPAIKYTREKAIRAYGAGSDEVRDITALLYPARDPRRYVIKVNEYVEDALAGCFGAMDTADALPQPAESLAGTARLPIPVLLTRKNAYDVLPEDAATVGFLLRQPDLVCGAAGAGAASDWLAGAHRVVVRETLITLGLLTAPDRRGAVIREGQGSDGR